VGEEKEALWWYRDAMSGYKSNLGKRSVEVTKAERKIQELEDKGVTVERCVVWVE
jgi:hypothetical protein